MTEVSSLVTTQQKDALFSRIRDDPDFRQLIKTDWRKALQELGITIPKEAGGELSRWEIEKFAGQKAGITVRIGRRGLAEKDLESIELREIVNFER